MEKIRDKLGYVLTGTILVAVSIGIATFAFNNNERIDPEKMYRCGDPSDGRSPTMPGAALQELQLGSERFDTPISVQVEDGRVLMYNQDTHSLITCYPMPG